MILLFPGDCDKEEEDNLSEKEDSTASGTEEEGPRIVQGYGADQKYPLAQDQVAFT